MLLGSSGWWNIRIVTHGVMSFNSRWLRNCLALTCSMDYGHTLIISAAMIALALTDKSPLVVGLLSGGPFILLGIHWIRHKHEVAQAHLFRPPAMSTPGLVFFSGMLAILIGALAVIGGAVGAVQQACRCF